MVASWRSVLGGRVVEPGTEVGDHPFGRRISEGRGCVAFRRQARGRHPLRRADRRPTRCIRPRRGAAGIERMCGVSPRFSWITSTAPRGDDASAARPMGCRSAPRSGSLHRSRKRTRPKSTRRKSTAIRTSGTKRPRSWRARSTTQRWLQRWCCCRRRRREQHAGRRGAHAQQPEAAPLPAGRAGPPHSRGRSPGSM